MRYIVVLLAVLWMPDDRRMPIEQTWEATAETREARVAECARQLSELRDGAAKAGASLSGVCTTLWQHRGREI